jgi:hypothetical protein
MDSIESAEYTYWQQLLSDQQVSGQPIAIFCRERQLSRSKFYSWKKQLQPASNASAATPKADRFVPVLLQETATPETAQQPSVAIEIRLRTGRSLLVGPGFSADHLRALLTVLERES